jgi:hypothetical protein
VRLGTYVLNAGFYKPALLARDAGELDKLSDGRLDLGLGAGYVREEFEAAELPYPTARQRVDYLEHTVNYLKKHLPSMPILIAGNGNRLLTIAAQHADIIGLTGAGNAEVADPLAERIDFVRTAAGDRFDDLELNLGITAVPSDSSGKPDLALTRRFVKLSDEELLALPAVLSGSPRRHTARLPGHLRADVVHLPGKPCRYRCESDRRDPLTAGFRIVGLCNTTRRRTGPSRRRVGCRTPTGRPIRPGRRHRRAGSCGSTRRTRTRDLEMRRLADSNRPAMTASTSATKTPGPTTPGRHRPTRSSMP